LPFGDEVAERGWRIGAVVPQAMVPAIAQYLARPGADPVAVAQADWLIVVSQTCDVLATRFDAEPLVEILHCRPIPKLRKGTKELRSTRTLDFKPNRETHGELRKFEPPRVSHGPWTSARSRRIAWAAHLSNNFSTARQ
jgi:hypothetical protein